jgi:hypothetical protein
MNDHAMTIRTATVEDTSVLQRLAELDSAPPLAGHVLVAELDGVAAAAVSVETGRATADPFRHTAGAVRALGRRRDEMRQRSNVAPLRSLLRRLAPNPAA